MHACLCMFVHAYAFLCALMLTCASLCGCVQSSISIVSTNCASEARPTQYEIVWCEREYIHLLRAIHDKVHILGVRVCVCVSTCDVSI